MGKFRTFVTRFVITLVAVVSGVLSAAHIIQLGLDALPPEHDWQAYLTPIPLDGALLLASLSLAETRRQNRKPGFTVWLTLFLGVAGSIAANLAAAPPTLTGRLLAVSAPIALALSTEILLSANHNKAPKSDMPIPAVPERDTATFITPEGKDTGEEFEALRNEPSALPRNTVTAVKPRTSRGKASEATSPGVSTDEANRLIAQGYVTRGMTPNRSQVRQDHRVGAQRADKIVAQVREMTQRQEAEARELLPASA